MSKSKCTCEHRSALAHVLNLGVPHEAHCHYAQVHEERVNAQEEKRVNKALYSTYRRQSK